MKKLAGLFICGTAWLGGRVRGVALRLPELQGRRIQVDGMPGLRDRRGPVDAGAFLRERRIAMSCAPRDFGRIFVHEVFHFAWLRLGNSRRRAWEELLAAELARRAPGELGWSAEWRKKALRPDDPVQRTRRWREYCCESFCDTAAWLYGGTAHQEHTLEGRARAARRAWFRAALAGGPVSI